MRRHKKDFERLGASVVMVGLGDVEQTAKFKQRFEIPFDMIADPHKALYEAFQLKQGTAGSLLSVGMFVKGLKAMAKGHHIGEPQGDVRQLPGVFIIDPKGRIQFSHYATGPADNPQPEALLSELSAEETV